VSRYYADIHGLIASCAQRYEYQKVPGIFTVIQDAIVTILRWCLDLLASFLSLVPGYTDTRSISNLMKTGMYILGLICAVLLVWFICRKMITMAKNAKSRTGSATAVRRILTSKDWFNQATEFSHQSNWKEACRCLLLASLRLLDEEKIVPFAATYTNFEYWYALSQHKKIRSAFREIADIVDVSWFGNVDAQEQDFNNCLQQFKKIEAELPRSGASSNEQSGASASTD
jgi:hypothetical protein